VTSDSGDSGNRRLSGPYYASDSSTAPFQATQSPSAKHGRYGNGPGRTGRTGRKRRKTGVILAAGAVAVVAAIAAVIVVVVSPSGGKSPTGFTPTGSSPEQDAQQITTAFLQAWAAGNLGQASRYTDHPSAAEAALAVYRQDLHLRKMTATAGTVTPGGSRESVTENIKATVATSDSATAISGAWSYTSTLTAYQQPNSSLWYIAWSPDVVAPNLTTATHLAAVEASPQVVSVTDSGGNALTSYNDAGLSYISTLLQQQAPPGQGSPGLYVEIQNAKNKAVPNSQAVVVSPSNIADLATTISPQAERAARSSVAMHPNSSMVVIQPSTGDILAIANNDGYNNFALTAQVAPGSTMKIITTTALFTHGLATADTDVECPPAYYVQGITIHNDEGESEPASTPLWYDFAQSCNNAFTQWWPKLSAPNSSSSNLLAATAKKYYGLDQKWDIGIPGQSASYFNAPPSASGSELAEEDFGQGLLEASPIAMASVAATVESGTFKQPILVPGTKQIKATPIPSSDDSQLYTEMRSVVTEGTAAGEGFGPDVYAKTGTADIAGQEQPNSWFVAFDPQQDVAIACLDLDAGYGAQFAAPEVLNFFNKY
jgi:hypothetical protein